MISHRTTGLLAAGMLIALAATGCTTVSQAETSPSAGAPASGAVPAAALGVDESARALLPASIRDAGVLTIAGGDGSASAGAECHSRRAWGRRYR